MSTLSVRLPDSIHKKIKELAKKEGVSMNQLINSAVSEKTICLNDGRIFKRKRRIKFSRKV